jgi:hypothetical protein
MILTLISVAVLSAGIGLGLVYYHIKYKSDNSARKYNTIVH